MASQSPPWNHDSYLALVRDWFFPDHAKQNWESLTGADSAPDMRQRAIDKVNLWMFKTGQLPPAIVATAALTEAILHDESSRGSCGSPFSETAVQSIYAMSFAKFVNGFVDRDIARSHAAEMTKEVAAMDGEAEAATALAGSGKGENSMYAHAATIGMPQTFVDLRHQVTHGDIPKVAYLRKTTEQALEWLWERWWIKNAAGSPELAVRELEDRHRISRDAKESRRQAKETSALLSDMLVDGQVARAQVDRPSGQADSASRKRKSTMIETNDDYI